MGGGGEGLGKLVHIYIYYCHFFLGFPMVIICFYGLLVGCFLSVAKIFFESGCLSECAFFKI